MWSSKAGVSAYLIIGKDLLDYIIICVSKINLGWKQPHRLMAYPTHLLLEVIPVSKPWINLNKLICGTKPRMFCVHDCDRGGWEGEDEVFSDGGIDINHAVLQLRR